MTAYRSEVADGMRIDWDVPLAMSDGVVLRADAVQVLGCSQIDTAVDDYGRRHTAIAQIILSDRFELLGRGTKHVYHTRFIRQIDDIAHQNGRSAVFARDALLPKLFTCLR